MEFPENKLRFDLQIIARHIGPGSSVLDLGCGRGDLLAWLEQNSGVKGYGIDQNEENAARCIARGLNVIQGDINLEVEDYPDQSFDYVILSQTLQQVYQPAALLRSLARIGRKVIVSFPNFSHYSIRLDLLLYGMAPKNNQLPYHWYDTPNIRVITIKDFRRFARDVGYNIVSETAIITDSSHTKGRIIKYLCRLRANYGIYVIEKASNK